MVHQLAAPAAPESWSEMQIPTLLYLMPFCLLQGSTKIREAYMVLMKLCVLQGRVMQMQVDGMQM